MANPKKPHKRYRLHRRTGGQHQQPAGPPFSYNPKVISEAEAREWLDRGLDRLLTPDTTKQGPITARGPAFLQHWLTQCSRIRTHLLNHPKDATL